MKKLLFLLIGLCILGGCEWEDTYIDYAYLGATSYEAPYYRYEFPAVDKQTQELVVYLTNQNAFDTNVDYRNDPGFSDKLLVISTNPADNSQKNIEETAFFEKLAEKYQNTPLEFVILVTGSDAEKIKQLEWVKDLRRVKVYYTGQKFYNLAAYGAEMPSIICMREDRPHVSIGWVAYDDLEYKDTWERVLEDFVERIYAEELHRS